MKTNYLFPNSFKKIGWIMSIPLIAILLIYLIDPPAETATSTSWNFFNTFKFDSSWHAFLILSGDRTIAAVCMVLLIVGLLFIAFSKEKIEDEYLAKMRGDSLVWAVMVNSAFLIVASLLIYDGWFLYISLLNLYTLLILFIIKFNITVYRFKKTGNNEE